jgi:hypothetical protein
MVLLSGVVQALTVDEIIKLKRAGVSDSTIELLIKRAGDAKSAGVWKQDGWIVHTTDTREYRQDFEPSFNQYPIAVYPWVGGARRHR